MENPMLYRNYDGIFDCNFVVYKTMVEESDGWDTCTYTALNKIHDCRIYLFDAFVTIEERTKSGKCCMHMIPKNNIIEIRNPYPVED